VDLPAHVWLQSKEEGQVQGLHHLQDQVLDQNLHLDQEDQVNQEGLQEVLEEVTEEEMEENALTQLTIQ